MRLLAALILSGCAGVAAGAPPVATSAPISHAQSEPTVASLAAEYAHARAEADRWTTLWKTADALKGAMERQRPAEEIARRRSEYDAARR